MKTRSIYETDYRLRRHDGEYRWMAVHGVPVFEKEGTIREWVGSCADITDRVQAEEEIRKLNERLEKRVVERTAALEAANKELEAFAYSVSHDLRAPLRAVDGFSRILLEEHAPQLTEDAQHYLTVVRKNAVQMGELIDDLLAFSRLSRQPLNRKPVDLGGLARQVIQDLDGERQGRLVEIEVGDLPDCEADPSLLRQVLANLLSNAIKYTRGRDRASIEVGAHAPEAAPRSISCATTEPASTCATPTSCSECSSACIGPRSTKAPESAWRSSIASSAVMAAALWAEAAWTRAPLFISHCRSRAAGLNPRPPRRTTWFINDT